MANWGAASGDNTKVGYVAPWSDFTVLSEGTATFPSGGTLTGVHIHGMKVYTSCRVRVMVYQGGTAGDPRNATLVGESGQVDPTDYGWATYVDTDVSAWTSTPIPVSGTLASGQRTWIAVAGGSGWMSYDTSTGAGDLTENLVQLVGGPADTPSSPITGTPSSYTTAALKAYLTYTTGDGSSVFPQLIVPRAIAPFRSIT